MVFAPVGFDLDGSVQRLMYILGAKATLHSALDKIKMVDLFRRLAVHLDQMTL
jgi:hypothetical protein